MRLRLDAAFVKRAARRPNGGLVVLTDVPVSLRSSSERPQRELLWLDPAARKTASVRFSAERQLLDFALHPSGELTALFASDAGYTLARFDALAEPRFETLIEDESIDFDPPALRPGELTGPIEPNSRDSGRVAALDENVVAAVRTARHSVVAHVFRTESASFSRLARTLVVPPMTIYPVGLTGGTYDTFDQVALQFAVQLAVGPDQTIYVGVQPPRADAPELPLAHERVFGEALSGDPDALDFYVTRLDGNGQRLGTSVVTTPQSDELYGLRAFDGMALAVGRTEYWNDRGTGFDALVARVDGATGEIELTELDVDASDLAFDAVPLEDGRLLVAGVSSYAQNPHGASITEESRAFAQIVTRDGGATEALPVPNGARHNEARVVLAHGDGSWLVGGMLDGPGTHSADSDESKLRATGFLDSFD